MKNVYRFAPALAALLCATSALAAQELPLRRVVITTSGLALYQHGGTVSGNTDLDISVRLDNVDDLLKSLTVLDDSGAIAGVSLPGREPLAQAFRDLPFSEDNLSSLTFLLNALRGAEVQASAGSQTVTGRLLAVTPETYQTKDGVTVRNRVAISTKEGVKTLVLEDLGALKFLDPAVQAQIDRALEAVFSSRIRDRRTVNVALKGQGDRAVTLAYIQAAPLWKSGYRLVLPPATTGGKAPDGKDPGAKAILQGWAVLENTTGSDWKDVSVTLTSGSPVTYTQALYESYYLPRPALPVKVMDRVLPRVDRGTVGMPEDGMVMGRMQIQNPQKPGAPMEKAQMNEMAMDSQERSMAYGGAMDGAVASSPPMPGAVAMAAPAEMPMQMAAATVALAQDAAGQMTFTFPEPVTLAAGNTLMVPFIAASFPAERLWVYQPETNPLHPLAAVELKNAGEGGLPPGILTLYDRSGTGGGLIHVGDAEMPLTPKGEHRFIPFALDAETNIDSQTDENRRLGLMTVSRGVLSQKAVWLNTTTYTIKAPAAEDRTIVIEHPRLHGWDLVKPEGVEGEPEVTATHYRLRVHVAAGKSASLKVTLKREDTERFALVDLSPDDLRARVAAVGKDLPDDLRKALEKVGTLRAAVYEIDAALQRIANERQTIAMDQQRMRENIQAVSTNSSVGKRYLEKMETQEDRLAALEEEEQDLNTRRVEAMQALETFVNSIGM